MQGETVKVRITMRGTSTLLMHNAQLSDPLNVHTQALKTVSKKRIKTDDDHLEMGRLKFMGSLYWDEESGPYIPGANIHACLIEAAKMTRQGPAAKRGIVIPDEVNPLAYTGPREPDALWADKNFRSRLSVKVTTSRVMRTRPQFRQWAVEADALLDVTQIDLGTITQIASTAGLMIGLGDYRPRFGRFDATVTQIKD